jgi:hypothetical protein
MDDFREVDCTSPEAELRVTKVARGTTNGDLACRYEALNGLPGGYYVEDYDTHSDDGEDEFVLCLQELEERP